MLLLMLIPLFSSPSAAIPVTVVLVYVIHFPLLLMC